MLFIAISKNILTINYHDTVAAVNRDYTQLLEIQLVAPNSIKDAIFEFFP